MESMQWWRLGIDIALGMRCDKVASDYSHVFAYRINGNWILLKLKEKVL